jgi:hypothetical protein
MVLSPARTSGGSRCKVPVSTVLYMYLVSVVFAQTGDKRGCYVLLAER